MANCHMCKHCEERTDPKYTKRGKDFFCIERGKVINEGLLSLEECLFFGLRDGYVRCRVRVVRVDGEQPLEEDYPSVEIIAERE